MTGRGASAPDGNPHRDGVLEQRGTAGWGSLGSGAPQGNGILRAGGRRRRDRPVGASPPAPRGFTLIEVVVVLAILSVSVALVLPAVGRGTDGLRLRTEAGRVAALLRQARERAVGQRHAARVSLDRTRNTVALTAADPDKPVRELSVPTGLRVSVARGGDTVTFSSRGLTRDTRWILEAPGGRRLAITVEGVTGRVTVAPEEGS